jgi:hypothetical protein
MKKTCVCALRYIFLVLCVYLQNLTYFVFEPLVILLVSDDDHDDEQVM